MNPLNRHTKYLVLDTETGGFSSKTSDILSIGYVVTTRTLRIIEKGEILIKGNPRRVEQQALDVNGIDLKEHNKVALPKREAVTAFDAILAKHWKDKKPTLVGQNVPFDKRFITALYKAINRKFKPDYSSIDLKIMWQGLIAFGKVNTPDAKQDTILDYLGVCKKGKRHSALVDAENVIKALRKIKKHVQAF